MGLHNSKKVIDDLTKIVVQMKDSVDTMMQQMLSCIKKPVATTLKEIITQDVEVDKIEIQIDEFASTIIALHQPVATDLRIIIGGMKISNDLERIADHISIIAERLISLNKNLGSDKLKKKLLQINCIEYSESINRIFQGVLQSYMESNTLIARGVCNSIEDVTEQSQHIVKELMTQISKDKLKLKDGLKFIQIVQNLERIARLSTNIAEDVIYINEAVFKKNP